MQSEKIKKRTQLLLIITTILIMIVVVVASKEDNNLARSNNELVPQESSTTGYLIFKSTSSQETKMEYETETKKEVIETETETESEDTSEEIENTIEYLSGYPITEFHLSGFNLKDDLAINDFTTIETSKIETTIEETEVIETTTVIETIPETTTEVEVIPEPTSTTPAPVVEQPVIPQPTTVSSSFYYEPPQASQVPSNYPQYERYASAYQTYPVATYVWVRLKEAFPNMSNAAIAGILGNMGQECGGVTLNLIPCIFNRTGTMYGICQWAVVYAPQIAGASLEVQVDYLISTIENQFRMFGKNGQAVMCYYDFNEFCNEQDPYVTAMVFELIYGQGAGDVLMDNRRILARQALDFFSQF